MDPKFDKVLSRLARGPVKKKKKRARFVVQARVIAATGELMTEQEYQSRKRLKRTKAKTEPMP